MGENAFFVEGDKTEFDPENWLPGSQNEPPKRAPETHLNVLVVGAGFAGLMTALECWRKGHNIVGILERNKGPNYSGDLVILGPSAVSVIRHWPDMLRELEEDRVKAATYYRRHNGELIYGPSDVTFNDPEYLAEREGLPLVGPVQIRKKFYTMLLRQVARLGLKVDYGQRVDKYFEDELAGLGGVVLEDGSIRVAHLVVAADAFKSRSELLVAGEYTPTRPSRMSVFRTAFPAKLAFQDETVNKRWGKAPATNEFWLGAGMHLGLFISPELVAFGITPRDEFLLKDNAKPIESWDPDVDPEDVVKVLEQLPGWDPAILALVKTAPKGKIIHWPLLWRDLRRDWTSKGGHVVQMGDAAHSTVPASVSGATLAFEDAITLATCLQLSSSGGGSGGAALGARIYNLLRYQRVSCNQKMAFVNSQLLNATSDWDTLKKDPQKVRLRFPKWVFRHDPEAYVYEKYGQAFAHLVTGAEFQNTNFPPGHKFVPWTLEEVYKDVGEGKRVEDLLDGDWS